MHCIRFREPESLDLNPRGLPGSEQVELEFD